MVRILFSVFICLFLFSVNAFCDPTLGGATGLIEMPSADALRYKEWNFGFSVHSDGGKDTGNNTSRPSHMYKFNLGTFKNLELGFIGRDSQEGVFINAKYYVMSDNTRYPLGLAFGLSNLSSYSDSNVYLVASKRFRQNFTAHLGFTADLQEKVVANLMAGTEIFMMNNGMSFLADVKGTEDTWRFNTGLRFYMNESLTIGIFGVDIFNSDEDQKMIVGQVSWTDFM